MLLSVDFYCRAINLIAFKKGDLMDLKRIIIIIILILYVLPTKVFSQKGCCSWHGGVAGCSENG